ncbi:MAG: lipopolysaccharide heptosyltransferase II [Candidatus Omnitrophica bacterium]|nr:lipopolysaccharide heptosyltransferase II [Candidatus Omnitrophota bacterium]
MRILITRTDRIGDVMLSTPVIRAIKAKYPDSYLAFCLRPETAPLIVNDPLVDEVIEYDKKGKYKKFKGMLNFAFEIRRKKFDMAIVLHPTNRMNLTCFLAGIKKRIGYDHKLGFLLTDRVAHKKQLGLKHETEYTLDLLRHIGIDPVDKRLRLYVSDQDIDRAKQLCEENYIPKGANVITVHPGASCRSKIWPFHKFAELIDRLNEDSSVRVILVGAQSDLQLCNKVNALVSSRLINLVGQTSIGVLAAILKKSKVFVSNDSGPVHMAVAVGTPVVDIFGRKDPGLSPLRWGPRGEKDIVIHKDAGCKKCLAHNCDKHFKCLDAISVDEVYDAVRSLY